MDQGEFLGQNAEKETSKPNTNITINIKNFSGFFLKFKKNISRKYTKLKRKHNLSPTDSYKNE